MHAESQDLSDATRRHREVSPLGVHDLGDIPLADLDDACEPDARQDEVDVVRLLVCDLKRWALQIQFADLERRLRCVENGPIPDGDASSRKHPSSSVSSFETAPVALANTLRGARHYRDTPLLPMLAVEPNGRLRRIAAADSRARLAVARMFPLPARVRSERAPCCGTSTGNKNRLLRFYPSRWSCSPRGS